MIRVRYSNGLQEEYETIGEAKFMITAVLFASSGTIMPKEAIEVIPLPDQGVEVEKVLTIRLGIVELD